MSGKLYVVGTPIGNLGDFSPRAKEVLSSVDFIAAEDTRVTVKLLNHFDIKKPLISYYEHNKADKGEWILNRISAGESCAVVSDAGMPCISDPGEDLVRQAHKAGIQVESVPGPSAVITALCISGMSSGRFTFEGFLSVNKPGRKAHLDELKNEKRTMIFYEAPHKLLKTLYDMRECFGEREITIARELTKLHETVLKTDLSGAISHFEATPPKGEFVLIVAGAAKDEKKEYTLSQAVKMAAGFVKDGEPKSAAAKRAAILTGLKKGDIYKELI